MIKYIRNHQKFTPAECNVLLLITFICLFLDLYVVFLIAVNVSPNYSRAGLWYSKNDRNRLEVMYLFNFQRKRWIERDRERNRQTERQTNGESINDI